MGCLHSAAGFHHIDKPEKNDRSEFFEVILRKNAGGASALEYYGLPYTGPDAAAIAIAPDKSAAKRIARNLGINTPEFAVITSGIFNNFGHAMCALTAELGSYARMSR